MCRATLAAAAAACLRLRRCRAVGLASRQAVTQASQASNENQATPSGGEVLHVCLKMSRAKRPM